MNATIVIVDLKTDPKTKIKKMNTCSEPHGSNDYLGNSYYSHLDKHFNEVPNLVIEKEKKMCHQKGGLSSPKCALNEYHDSSCNSDKMLLDEMISVKMELDPGAIGKCGRLKYKSFRTTNQLEQVKTFLADLPVMAP